MRTWLIGLSAVLLIACGGGDDGGKDTVTSVDTAKVDTVSVDTPLDTPLDTPQDTLQVDTGPEAFSTGYSAKGYGEFCTTFADCQEFGLSCFITGQSDLYPVCSKKCETNLDCPEYFVCGYKTGWAEPAHICLEARYCDECQDDVQCMLPGMKCIADAAGAQFCSSPCTPGVLGCDAGSECKYFPDREDWFCSPLHGSCLGEGQQCDPCRFEQDCQAPDHHCLTMYYSKEKFCAKDCATNNDCPEGSACVDVSQTAKMCITAVGTQAVPSCHLGTQDYCQACTKDYQCAEGLGCFHDATGAGGFCSMTCQEHTDCPPSTQCTGWYDLYDGHLIDFACAPGGEYTCERYLKDQLPATD
jgi:hypothetical protein